MRVYGECENGAEILIRDSDLNLNNPNNRYKWRVVRVGSGSYKIESVECGSAYVLSPSYNKCEDGRKIMLKPWESRSAQIWGDGCNNCDWVEFNIKGTCDKEISVRGDSSTVYDEDQRLELQESNPNWGVSSRWSILLSLRS